MNLVYLIVTKHIFVEKTIEHLFRFAKNKLLLNNYYSTEVKRENNWVNLVFLSYVNLWASRHLAQQVTSDWQKYYRPKNA